MSNLLKFIRPAKAETMVQNDAEIDRLYRKYRLGLIFAMTIGYSLYYTTRLGLAITRGPLIELGIATPTEIGQIGGALFYGYAFGKLVNGFIADHLNIRKLFAMGLVLSAVCNFVFGFSTSILAFTIAWAFNGWFQGIGAGCCSVALASWWTKEERGRFYGIWSTSHAWGEGATYVLTAAVVTWLGWRAGFVAPAILCTFAAFVIYIFYQDRPAARGLPPVGEWKREHEKIKEAHIDAEKAEVSVKPSSHLSLKDRILHQLSVVKSIPIWIVCLAASAMYVTRYAVGGWGILFLQEAKGMPVMAAGTIMGVNTAAAVVGGVSYGFFSDKVFNGRRPPANLVWGIIQVAGLVGMFILPFTNYWLIMGSFALFGFGMGGLLMGLSGLFVIDIASRHAAGAAMGFVGVFSYVGAALQENISGILIERGMTVVDGVNQYDFTAPIIFWISSAVISIALGSVLWNAKTSE